jgi:hypothetical protein
MKDGLLFALIITCVSYAQNPDPAFNPMTAAGAIGIHTSSHTLYWQNPTGIIYNECYFSSDSALVAGMNASVKIQSGYPSLIYNSVVVNSLSLNTRYFWRIVEYNSSGYTPSPVWHFRTQASPVVNSEYHFASGLEGFTFFGPMGAANWYWSNSSGAGGTLGELVFRWDPVFVGESYMISPEIPAPAGLPLNINFKFYEDWWSNIVVIGCAYTTNNGYSWTSIWEISATGNVGPDVVYRDVLIPGNFRLGFYYTGNSNDIDFYRIDDIYINSPSSIASPPTFLQAEAQINEQKVSLMWNSGSTSGAPITGYLIQRKDGLPGNSAGYATLATTDASTFSFDDNNVELNHTYTYRISSISTSGNYYGNESTAYVPAAVPVELISFTAAAIQNDVVLKWETGSEQNNRGFEVERSVQPSREDWQTAGFVSGAGTSTEKLNYTFTDRNLKPGKYIYRLKQLDNDGSFEYSKEIEAVIEMPAEFSLQQNYPNPFNPSTTIEFSLPANELVSLKVYDPLGNEIKNIVNDRLEAGKHSYRFDAAGLSSGTYFYRLIAGGNVAVKTMAVLK